ncbi:MAG: hypothetical protein ACYTG5_17810 [Planctomycetota bacterium]|jgi:hypothetical protein
MESTELAVIGLTCNLVGVFFLANSIIFRRPRKVMEEFFGVGAGSMVALRDYSLNKMQVAIGFLFLNTGFLLQVFALFGSLSAYLTTAIICVSIIAFAGLVYFVGWVYSRRSFRRLLRDFFKRDPTWSFAENMTLTKEIGKYLGISQSPEESIDEYIKKVRFALDLPANSRAAANVPHIGGGDQGRKLRDIGVLPGRGA